MIEGSFFSSKAACVSDYFLINNKTYLELANMVKLKISKETKNTLRLMCCIRNAVGATITASASIIVIMIVDICWPVRWRLN